MTPDSRDQAMNAPLTRTEAIRRAIDVLGPNAQVPQILDYVWEQYGIGVPPTRAVAPPPQQTSPARPGPDKLSRHDSPATDSGAQRMRETADLETPEGSEMPLRFSNPSARAEPASESSVTEAMPTGAEDALAAPEDLAPPKKTASKRTRPKDRPSGE